MNGPPLGLRLRGQYPDDLADGSVAVVSRYDVGAGFRDDPHEHPWHQLDWAPTGVLNVEIDGVVWVVPPSVGLWIPAGVQHAVGASRSADLHHITFYPGATPRLDHPPFDRPILVTITHLLRSLFAYLADEHLPSDERDRGSAVVVDALRPSHELPLDLRLPSDERALLIARTILGHPSDQRSIAAWGQHVGASRRTLTRVFRNETGLSFHQWRTQARLQSAIVHLVNGHPVETVAGLVGYASASAFIAVFQRAVGLTPGQYRARTSPGGAAIDAPLRSGLELDGHVVGGQGERRVVE